MKVVIIEDEQLTAQRLENMLHKYDATIQVTATIPSVAEAVEWFTSNEDPDLVFMDIHLEDDQCFTIFEKINLDVPVIFTTAYDEYMIKAFKVNSIDYLMKPVNYEELVNAIEKFKKLQKHYQENGLESLLGSVHKKEPEYKQRFLISVGSKLKTIDISEVSYFYCSEKITFLVTKENQRLPIDYSLDKLVLLTDPKQFFRVNRALLIKLDSIGNMHVFPKGKIKLDLAPAMKEDVFVSLDKVTSFKEWLGK
jgi:DNA-binding LytR/AlgR family response regulator